MRTMYAADQYNGNEQLRHFALWFMHSHSGASGVFWLNCRIVYFWCGAKMTDASSEIDVHRLRVAALKEKYYYIVDD